MTDHAKMIVDVSSLTIVAGTLMSYLPAVAALASFVLAQTGHLVELPTLDMSEMMPLPLRLRF